MTPLFEFSNVWFQYDGLSDCVLCGLTVAIPRGEKIAVLGRNGAGKSTFFLHCNGLLRPQRGEIRFRDESLSYTRTDLRQMRRQVGIVFQNPDDQLFSASVRQDISFGPLNLGLSLADTARRVRQAAELCGVSHLLDRPTHALSGGEKARVAMAGVLAMEPSVLLADELMSAIDPWARLDIFEIFQALHNRGTTVLLATHDLSVVRYWATHVIVLQKGKIAFSGTPAQLLGNQSVLETTELSKIWWNVEMTMEKRT